MYIWSRVYVVYAAAEATRRRIYLSRMSADGNRLHDYDTYT